MLGYVGFRADALEERIQRLAAKDLDDWEQKRIRRFKGEPDGIL